MKKHLIIASFVLISLLLKAQDVVVLNEGGRLKGSITSIVDKKLTIVDKKHKEHTFTPEQVWFVKPDLYNKLLYQPDSASYHKGYQYAKQHHKRHFGNFCLGFFFGAFGVAGTAVVNPPIKPWCYQQLGFSIRNYDYHKGYNKAAKATNLKNAAFGWGSFIVMYLVQRRVTTNPL